MHMWGGCARCTYVWRMKCVCGEYVYVWCVSTCVGDVFDVCGCGVSIYVSGVYMCMGCVFGVCEYGGCVCDFQCTIQGNWCSHVLNGPEVRPLAQATSIWVFLSSTYTISVSRIRWSNSRGISQGSHYCVSSWAPLQISSITVWAQAWGTAHLFNKCPPSRWIHSYSRSMATCCG